MIFRNLEVAFCIIKEKYKISGSAKKQKFNSILNRSKSVNFGEYKFSIIEFAV